MASLRKIAAELYPRETDQRRLVAESGLRMAAIAFDSSADNSWSSILNYANTQRKLDQLFDLLVAENEDNELLQRIKAGQPALILSGPSVADTITWQGPKNARPLLEKIIGTRSTLVPVSYLAMGLRRARAVVKVRRSDGSSGSGLLTGQNILITNNHVIPDAAAAAAAVAQFNYQQSIEGADEPVAELKLKPADFFATSEQDDWTAVRVEGDPKKDWGTLTLLPAKLKKDDRVNIIQHPGGGYKQLSFFSNTVVFVGQGRVQYLTDTLPGSSGAPVFDQNWNVVALHHSGGWLQEPGSTSTETFFRNEGILIDVILAALSPKNVLT